MNASKASVSFPLMLWCADWSHQPSNDLLWLLYYSHPVAKCCSTTRKASIIPVPSNTLVKI